MGERERGDTEFLTFIYLFNLINLIYQVKFNLVIGCLCLSNVGWDMRKTPRGNR